jgi:hypothetical protein
MSSSTQPMLESAREVSAGPRPASASASHGLSDAQMAELARRIAAVEAGTVRMYTMEEVDADLDVLMEELEAEARARGQE